MFEKSLPSVAVCVEGPAAAMGDLDSEAGDDAQEITCSTCSAAAPRAQRRSDSNAGTDFGSSGDKLFAAGVTNDVRACKREIKWVDLDRNCSSSR
ncbi:hypothetical protein ACLKA6_002031 [Drosophila palustris]